MQQNGKTQEVLERAADTSLQVQETAVRVGRAAGQVAGGVVTGACAAIWRFGGGLLKGGIEGSKVGMGHFVQATEVSLRRAKQEIQGEEKIPTSISCQGCGTELDPSSKFCNNCGQPVSA